MLGNTSFLKVQFLKINSTKITVPVGRQIFITVLIKKAPTSLPFPPKLIQINTKKVELIYCINVLLWLVAIPGVLRLKWGLLNFNSYLYTCFGKKFHITSSYLGIFGCFVACVCGCFKTYNKVNMSLKRNVEGDTFKNIHHTILVNIL